MGNRVLGLFSKNRTLKTCAKTIGWWAATKAESINLENPTCLPPPDVDQSLELLQDSAGLLLQDFDERLLQHVSLLCSHLSWRHIVTSAINGFDQNLNLKSLTWIRFV